MTAHKRKPLENKDELPFVTVEELRNEKTETFIEGTWYKIGHFNKVFKRAFDNEWLRDITKTPEEITDHYNIPKQRMHDALKIKAEKKELEINGNGKKKILPFGKIPKE